MAEQMVNFFVSFFTNPSIWGISLAILFGAIWLVAYWPPLFTRHWLWAVLLSSAILTLVGIAFIQIPLQLWTRQILRHLFNRRILSSWLVLTEMPAILLSGLVQEGTKLLPVVAYWWRKGRNIDPKLGLAIGAVAGAGFGVFEAQWAHNNIFAFGWTWAAVQTGGLVALAGFWERFFTVAFHTAACALASYGLATRRGWQFYLLASFLHTFINFSII